MERTATDHEIERPSRPTSPRIALTILMNASTLELAPSRHVLAGIDAVTFGRGKRDVRRERADGLRTLAITLPDRMMSTAHCRLLRAHGTWMLDDPRSKNGCVVAGVVTRCAPVRIGDVIEIGHTLAMIEAVDIADDAPQDHVLAADHGFPLRSYHDALRGAELARIARSDIPIVIHGETGTGKELYARAVHELSGRRGSFVAINCGALAPTLLEAELFGHKKGAFSGAIADRVGLVRSADGGTLFLDEVHELSPAAQVALLRVLQEREVVPVGDERAVKVELRVCAASPRRLLAEVEGGRFREDLYARLLGYELALPPLRDRRVDLGLLCHALAPGLKLSTAAARGLLCYGWPRNIRELERILATARVLAGDAPITLAHVPPPLREAAERATIATGIAAHDATPVAQGDDLRSRLATKLVEHAGNVSAVARDLGEHREQVRRWIRKLGFDLDAFRR